MEIQKNVYVIVFPFLQNLLENLKLKAYLIFCVIPYNSAFFCMRTHKKVYLSQDMASSMLPTVPGWGEIMKTVGASSHATQSGYVVTMMNNMVTMFLATLWLPGARVFLPKQISALRLSSKLLMNWLSMGCCCISSCRYLCILSWGVIIIPCPVELRPLLIELSKVMEQGTFPV